MITREQAICQQLNRYYDGTPCKNGHISEKYVRDSYCCECKSLSEKRNKSRRLEHAKKYYNNNKEKVKARTGKYAADNSIKISLNQREWRTNNADKIRQYRKDNRGLYAYHTAKRRKRVKQATPKWVNMEEIKQLYLLAAKLSKETGILHEVDHIIPLTHDLVCGLHCLENLRVIPKIDNIKKSNKFTPTFQSF